ncbi:metallophosphoesterase family protein [Jeotgalibacillus haloalkalitolerans]|uniref:Metallophosphoesterase family protein n=1 Tax=Jeotgalibacillus haloalkalitolerans TaxID=3104292 RepID=A0ABU5KN28_9BACL|nr:metallophosphoesterase family protein [Jeotgalibacillus sp. HH7-29]MDZ5712659.1 metallophosphoesterase family protein [Jeotgalibacillus sp. HH7-29]
MKIAVMTDIHGNAPALKSVLHELDRRGDVKHIYCLGDMIGIGPDTNEVLEILFARNDVSMMTGNHDEAVLALLKGEEHPLSHAHAKAHHQWIADKMDKIFISRLDQLPRTLNVTVEGQTILFTHYHIEQKKLNDHISQDPFSRIVEPELESLKTLFKEHKERLICFGHHHPLHYFKDHDQYFLNPGSLGCSSKPAAPYAIVNVEQAGIEVSLQEAFYDKTEFLASYELLQVPDRNFLMRVFHGEK